MVSRWQAILYERHRLELARHRYPLYPALAAILEGGPVPGDPESGPARAAPHSVVAVVARTMALSAAADAGNTEELIRSGSHPRFFD